MNTKHTISITEARKRIFDIAEEVQMPGSYYTLTDKGRPKVVVMSAEEYESLVETLEVMQDFPDLKKDVAKARQEYKMGKCITLDDFLAKEGLVAADKSNKQYKEEIIMAIKSILHNTQKMLTSH
ncbi:MAG: type II toxin-antitoxin system Phd/YefM family antitoxin [bacterium]|nr:type II toxin-antitoxin system Phd/YefM family antitoxin [bacterium]